MAILFPSHVKVYLCIYLLIPLPCGDDFLTGAVTSVKYVTSRFLGSVAERLERWLRVRVPLQPLAGFVHGSLELKSSATLVNSQLVCLRPVGILNPVKFSLNYLFQAFARPH